MDFEWDDAKAASNESKHGVSFDDATTVFRNPLAIIFDDKDHSDEEAREIILGHSFKGTLLVISFAEREDKIRIISTRKVTKNERKEYESHAFQ
ncbi:MAG: BrnT family toxin [Deinococcota bacterium]